MLCPTTEEVIQLAVCHCAILKIRFKKKISFLCKMKTCIQRKLVQPLSIIVSSVLLYKQLSRYPDRYLIKFASVFNETDLVGRNGDSPIPQYFAIG